MNIYQRIINQHKQLLAKGPQGMGPIIQDNPQGYIIGVPSEVPNNGEEVGASISLLDYDRYTLILRHLEVMDNSLTIKTKVEDYLHQSALAISQRLTYLEEPLLLLELDSLEGLAQLRSSPPQSNEDRLLYWELILRTTPHPHARLARYCWHGGDYERRPQPHPVTAITLARIAADLATSLTTASA